MQVIGFVLTVNPQAACLSFLFFGIVFLWELLIINEEILVLGCFGAAVLIIHENVSNAVVESLEERRDAIHNELSAFIVLKQENLKALYESEKSMLNTTQNLIAVQKFCRHNFATLDEAYKDCLAPSVATILLSQLDALKGATGGLQPALQKQIALSFRESILESNKRSKSQGKNVHGNRLSLLKKVQRVK